jgi:hypothetical protein
MEKPKETYIRHILILDLKTKVEKSLENNKRKYLSHRENNSNDSRFFTRNDGSLREVPQYFFSTERRKDNYPPRILCPTKKYSSGMKKKLRHVWTKES